MSKALTVESEESLRPMLIKPKDSEFKRGIRLSIDAETTKEFPMARSDQIAILSYLLFKEYRAFKPVTLGDITKGMKLDCDIYKAMHALIHISSHGTLSAARMVEGTEVKLIFEPTKKPTFGVSLTGIRVEKGEITIDPKELEQDIFYLFSYKDEKYVARKTHETTVEVYEVLD